MRAANNGSTPRRAGLGLLVVTVLLAPISADATERTPAESAGLLIYEQGVSPTGEPIFARVGARGIRLPGRAMPCGSCHGPDGLGRPEGGVEPPSITWDALTKPYGHRHADGRAHPPFSRESLETAITQGLDPAGNRLDPSMPRYEMANSDLDELIGHLARLGRESAPGVAERTLVLGLLLPRAGPFEGPALAGATLLAYFDRVNAQGGIYGRRIRIMGSEAENDAASFEAAAKLLLAEPVFALVGAIPPVAQPELARLFEAEKVPLVHLLPPAPQADAGAAYGFYLLSGPRQEADCLLGFAHGRLSAGASVAIATGARPIERALAEHLVSAAEMRGLTPPRVFALPASQDEADGLARTLSKDHVGAVLALQAGEPVERLIGAAMEAGWTPDLLLPSSLSDGKVPALPEAYEGRMFAAYPTLPADWQPSGLRALAALDGQEAMPRHALLSRIVGYVAGALVEEALRRAGKDLGRAGFVDALEALYRFEIGLTPPLTFGPNRRIGARGAYVVEIASDPSAGMAAGPWCEAPE